LLARAGREPATVANKTRGLVRTATRRSFLIWLSGADLDTLSRSPRERRKFSGLGGVVLTTSCMASVSMAFALHNGVRAALWAAIVVALLWGLAIANLDRWLIVAATRRKKWWQNLASAAQRTSLPYSGVATGPAVSATPPPKNRGRAKTSATTCGRGKENGLRLIRPSRGRAERECRPATARRKGP
jgi:hypothetical protein